MFIRVESLVIAVLLGTLLRDAEARLGQRRQPYIVKLWKEHARESPQNVSDKPDHGFGYFVGPIQVGLPVPQELHVAFSTTAGMLVLPSSECSGASCTAHRRYYPEKSESSVDVQQDGSPVDEAGGRRAPAGASRDGTTLNFQTNDGGGDVVGQFVSEVVCFGDRLGSPTGTAQPVCSNVTLVVATTMMDTFRTRPQDGIVGLGLEGLSIGPAFNFVASLGMEGLKPQFSIFVQDDAHGAELVFGGHDPSRLESSLTWVPVTKAETGHWLVSVAKVRVGDKTLDICRGENRPCVGLVDTSSPGLVIPGDLYPEVEGALKPDGSSSAVQGSCSLPDFSLELEGGFTIQLGTEDYAGPKCEPEIRQHHMKTGIDGADLLLLGEPVLRRYYTVFDWEAKRVGFGRARVERSCKRLHEAWLPTSSSSCVGPLPDSEAEDEVVLSQTFWSALTGRSEEHMET